MRLLIAEPDLHACWSARLLLSHAGHEIVAATTSAAAAAVLAREAGPDLCLIDAALAASEDGDGAATGWSQSDAPCLLLGDDDSGTPRAPTALGCLARPFGALELLEAVEICRGLMRREEPPARVDRLKRLTLYAPDAGAQ